MTVDLLGEGHFVWLCPDSSGLGSSVYHGRTMESEFLAGKPACQ